MERATCIIAFGPKDRFLYGKILARNMGDERFMKMAIAKAREGMAEGQAPFGACVVRGGEVVSCEHNRVWRDTDITAHAEIVAIREACRAMGTVDLSCCEIYATTEPCPMCFSAIHWARIGKVYFGSCIEDAAMTGFNELRASNREMAKACSSPVKSQGGMMREECQELFREFLRRPGRKTY